MPEVRTVAFMASESPLYNWSQCPFLSDQVSCQRNGRADFEYESWSWEAKGLFGLAILITQFSVFITQFSKMVGPISILKKKLVWQAITQFPIFCFHHSIL